MKLLVFLLLLAVAYCQRCETNVSPYCSVMYNRTRYPNSLKHLTQRDGISAMGHYSRLLDANCSQFLSLFLCSVFVPMCTMLDEHILPCRSLCQEVKGECEDIVRQYTGLPWPAQLDCRKFPEEKPGTICIQLPKKGEPVEQQIVQPNVKKSVHNMGKIKLKCPFSQTIHIRKMKTGQNSDCNRSVSLAKVRRLCNDETECKFELKDLTRDKNQPQSCRNKVFEQAVIRYTCKDEEQQKSVNISWGMDKNIECKSMTRYLSIVRVKFGAEMCHSPISLCAVKQICEGKPKCPLFANYRYITSECPKTKARLEVEYKCLKYPDKNVDQYSVEVYEGSEIKCNQGHISLIRAEAINPGSESACKTEVHCKIKVTCHKQQKCKIDLPKCRRKKIRLHYVCL